MSKVFLKDWTDWRGRSGVLHREDDYVDKSHFFFYTTPYVNETNLIEKIDPDQWKSLKLCIEADNILTNFLDNEYGELTKAATLVGFKNNAFCYHPA